MCGCAQLSSRCAELLALTKKRRQYPKRRIHPPYQMGYISGVTCARRRYVPVTIVHSDSGSRLQQLDAARVSKRLCVRRPSGHWRKRGIPSTILRQSSATNILRRTRLRGGNDAEKRRIEEALASAQEELATGRVRRARAEHERDEATVARETPEKRLREMTVGKPVENVLRPPSLSTVNRAPRCRGRPRKIPCEQPTPDNSDVVEWRVPGWKDRFG
jgi:hypothetical protein